MLLLKMKNFQTNFVKKTYLLLVLIIFSFPRTGSTQSFCSTTKLFGVSGYSASIESVYLNDSSTYNIIIRVSHNGCNDATCKALNQLSIEADEGTYSDVSYVSIFGNVTSGGINLGPNLGGTPFDGFRIASISGIGNGQAGVFHVIYTLSYLQDQQIQVKAGGLNEIVMFTEQEFNDVLNCNIGGAYAMPDGGKINDVTNKIGPELTALANYVGVPLSNGIYNIVLDESTNTFYVVAEFVPIVGQYQSLLYELETNYGLIETTGDGTSLISGQVPIDQLLLINNLSSLAYARPIYPVTTNTGLLSTSQGDTSMLSYISRNIFAENNDEQRNFITGSGVKIGVISNSYNTKQNPSNQANDDVLKFELPGIGYKTDGTTVANPYNDKDVVTVKEYPYGEASDEGRAMMQIIHDVSPGAELYFRTGVLGAVDMAKGIDELINSGCNVIVDDITYITEPFFEDGLLAQKVDSVSDIGVSYFTSAGNFGSKSYTGTFTPSTTTLEGVDGTPHLFGYNGGFEDIYQSVTADLSSTTNPPAYYTIVLQWDDGSPYNSTTTDLDIYITNGSGSGLIGYNTINTGGKAIEVLPFVVTETAETNIVVVNASDNNYPVTFKYVVFKGQLSINEYENGNSTIVGHANSEKAITVGAIRYDKTPAYGGSLDIMSYSSIGGQLVNGADRYKPDLTAPNGVNTTVDLGNGDWDHLTDPDADTDLLPNFFGTSASAPHAAAVAALLINAKSSFYEDMMTPSEIKSTLISTAIGSGSYDNVYGNGFIQADAALLTIANPSPILNQIDTIIGTPGIEDIAVTISGNYLTESTVLYFNSQELATEVDLEAGTLQAIFPVFSELYPTITAYNPPKSGTNGKDGGMSNALYFSEKPTIVGTIPDEIKTYGEDMPTTTTTYEVVSIDGSTQTLQESGLTNSQINRIQSINILNNASALANAGIWPYYVNPDDVLNPLYVASSSSPPLTDDESFLLDNFRFSFNIGELEIDKLNLTIIPNDKTITYGEPVIGLTYTFSYDSTNISQGPDGNNQFIQDSLYLAYNGDLIADRTALIDSGFYMADSLGGLVANSYYMTADAYINGQALALVNGKALALVNGQALALVNGQALALVNNLDSLSIVNGKALALVNGKALALVNRQALALVNTEAETNGLALALVNRQALALVNTELETEAFVNGKALALVNRDVVTNKQALALVNLGEQGLVNRQALALVNATTMNEVTNTNAIIILTVDDIKKMESGSPMDDIELISINTISGNTSNTLSNPHQIAPGAFNASNFNVQYQLGNLYVDPAPISFTFDDTLATYDGTSHEVFVTPTYPDYMISPPEVAPYTISYIDDNGNESNLGPVNAGTYTVKITITNPNFTFSDQDNQELTTLTINPAPVDFQFTNTSKVYNGQFLTVEVITVVTQGTASLPVEGLDFIVSYDGDVNPPQNAASYTLNVIINNSNYSLNSYLPLNPEFIIQPAPVSFSYNNTLQVYDGSPLSISVTVNYDPDNTPPPLVNYEIKYSFDEGNTYETTMPINAGSYPVQVVIADPNYIDENGTGVSETTFLISPSPVTFTFSNDLLVFNGNGQAITVNSSCYPEGVTFDTKYSFDGGINYETTLPVNVGTYPVQVIITDPNYIDINGTGETLGTFNILPSPVTFSFSNEVITYSGSEESISVNASSNPEGVTYEVLYSFNGGTSYETTLPVNAGSYPVQVIITNPNYTDANGLGVSESSLVISPSPVTFTFSNDILTYNGSGQSITVSASADPVGVTYDLNYSNDGGDSYISDLPVAVGNYPVQVSITNPNYVDANGQGVSSSILTINPQIVTFTYSGNNTVYNGYAQGITVSPTPVLDNYEIWYTIDGIATTNQPINAGDFDVNVLVTDNNYISDPASSITLFSINKATLNVASDNKVINEGDSLPQFTFTYTGFQGNDNEISVFGSGGPNYTVPYIQGTSGPGEYAVSFPTTDNYSVEFNDPIYLYVNPNGPGTKAVKPSLDCVIDQADGTYTAYFLYDNKNNDPVWVFIGVDNIVTGGGPNRDISQQPFKFEAGGGSWTATFDGSQMKWEVSSQDHGHKTSNAQVASSNSKNCNKSAEIDTDDDGKKGIRIYPNPVRDIVNVYSDNLAVIKKINVVNIIGIESNVHQRFIKDNYYELNMRNLKPGVYIIRVYTDSGLKVFRILKN